MKLLPLYFLSFLLFLAPFLASSYDYWNAQNYNVSALTRFLIDTTQDQIILAAKNSVCHVNFNLTKVKNFQDVTPSSNANDYCENTYFKTEEECQNYHYILLFPDINTTIPITIGGSSTSLSDTVLVCGTNAYNPQCEYRLRSDLSQVQAEQGDNFVPYDDTAVMVAHWTSSGRLVSATPLDYQPQYFGIVMSQSPYHGTAVVRTKVEWFHKSPQFVSMYEIGDYIYTFYREEPLENTQEILYTRASRICKDDLGVEDGNSRVFISFMKARMSCFVGGRNGDIPYHYNELQDSFLVENGFYDDSSTSERHLYALFTAPANGPVGSAVCVYTFGSHDNDLETVFRGNYLTRVDFKTFNPVPNPNPLTCPANRTLEEAERNQLMLNVAKQVHKNTPLLDLTGYSLKKLAVSRVEGLGGVSKEVMFSTGIKSSSLVLLKTTYSSADAKHKVLWEEELCESRPDVAVTQIEVLSDHVYVGTTKGLYRFPASGCSQYRECSECVGARDPHCAYDKGAAACVPVGEHNRASTSLLQGLRAESVMDVCGTTPGTTTSTIEPTDTNTHQSGTTASTRNDGGAASSGTPTSTSAPIPPNIVKNDGISTTSSSSSSHLGIILGTVFGFVGGAALGVIGMAIFFNRKKYVWNKYLGNGEEEAVRSEKEAAATNKDRKSSGANQFSKPDEFDRNNHDSNSSLPIVHHINPTVVNHSDGNAGSSAHCGPQEHSLSPPPYSLSKPNGKTSSSGSLPLRSNLNSSQSAPSQNGDVAGRSDHIDGVTTCNGGVAIPTHTAPACNGDVRSPTLTTHTDTPHSSQPHSRGGDVNRRSQIMHGVPAHRISKDSPAPHSPLTLSIPTTPSHYTPTASQQAPLALSLAQHTAPRPHPKPAQYRRSHSHATTTPSYSTLPHKRLKSHSGSTLPQRPSSAQNLHSCTTPTKTPGSPFSAAPAARTPVSTVSSCSPYKKSRLQFQFPPTSAVFAPGRNPNVKATAKMEQPTTNQERERYGTNMAAIVHTIDRKNKLVNGHSRSHAPMGYSPHTRTTVVEIHDGYIGCSDC